MVLLPLLNEKYVLGIKPLLLLFSFIAFVYHWSQYAIALQLIGFGMLPFAVILFICLSMLSFEYLSFLEKKHEDLLLQNVLIISSNVIPCTC